MKKSEIVLNVVIIAFSIFMLGNSFKLHGVRRFGEMGSGFWPALALSVATLLSVILLISNVIKYKKEKKGSVERPPLSVEEIIDLKSQKKRFVLSVIFLLLYIIIMPWIGFILSTILYVLAFILALEERRKYVLALSPILVTALIIVVFARFLTIPFPRGGGIFAAFSRLFY